MNVELRYVNGVGDKLEIGMLLWCMPGKVPVPPGFFELSSDAQAEFLYELLEKRCTRGILIRRTDDNVVIRCADGLQRMFNLNEILAAADPKQKGTNHEQSEE